MKKLTEHLHNEMFITQIIYEFNVNLSHHSCFKYFIKEIITYTKWTFEQSIINEREKIE